MVTNLKLNPDSYTAVQEKRVRSEETADNACKATKNLHVVNHFTRPGGDVSWVVHCPES